MPVKEEVDLAYYAATNVTSVSTNNKSAPQRVHGYRGFATFLVATGDLVADAYLQVCDTCSGTDANWVSVQGPLALSAAGGRICLQFDGNHAPFARILLTNVSVGTTNTVAATFCRTGAR